ncbi:MAG: XRE family transcriptional regulator [Saprospiraceae bacterium]|nr:helix-turn-helix transcriptional regulator [Lewinella sp.]
MQGTDTDAAKVTSSYIIHGIGPKIRELRKEKGILLSELGEQSNLSTAMISKIENGRVIPTIPSLLNILRALDIEPEVFFAEINGEPEFMGYIHLKPSDYKQYIKEESAVGFLYRSILENTIDAKSFQISHVSLEPNNHRPKVMTEAYEFLYILEGEIVYYLNDEMIILQAGESLFFDGKIPHVPLNRSNRPASYIVLYLFNSESD